MDILNLEKLQISNVSHKSNASNYPFVIDGKDLISSHKISDIYSFFKDNGELIRNTVKKNGALLFRGLPLGSPKEYEKALTSLGYDLFVSNYGGASPRPNITKKTFVSTEAPSPMIIGYHTEFCYQTTRPGMISFFCIQPAAKYGETPLFNCAQVWSGLSNELQTKLEAKGLLYRRFFPGKKSFINLRKTWHDAFETQDKKVVEKYLKSEGMSFTWDKNDGLYTELLIPAVLTDAEGKKHLSITTFNADSFVYNFRLFKDRYSAVGRIALEWYSRWAFSKKDAFLQVFFGDGTSFSKQESEELQRVAWENSIVFKWQENDFLILDNVSFAHSRLSLKKPRKVIAAMADSYNVRDYANNC